jgi:hypothetical protein
LSLNEKKRTPQSRVVQTLKKKFIEAEEKLIPLEHINIKTHFMHFWDWDKHFNKSG